MCVLSLIRAGRPSVTTITAIRYSLVSPPSLPKQHYLSLTKISAPALTQIRQFVTSKVLASSEDPHEERHFAITPSRYSWNKYKDMLHFYTMLGLIPCLAIVFYVNVFIGPATLKPIPEGYTPKEYEYHRHPITRFLAHYFFTSHQEDYERNLFYMAENEEIRKMRILDRRVQDLMAYRGDYPNHFVAPTIHGKYHRQNELDAADMYRDRGVEISDTSPGDY